MNRLIVVASVCCLLTMALTGSAPAEERVSTGDDQVDVAVTVYNSNLGLVRDLRKIELPGGTLELRFMDVAGAINPQTVHIDQAAGAGVLTVLEQNFEYDLINQQKLLEKYLGKKVVFLEIDENTKKTSRTEAVVLAAADDKMVFEIDGEIYFEHPGMLVLPELPENLISKPTLVWLLDNDGAGTKTVEASYLTREINWSADYVALLDRKDTSLDLSGWVTIENRSGATYNNALLKLVAGEIHKVEPPVQRYEMMKAQTVGAARAPAFAEKPFFEYHLYTLDRRTTIKDNQTKQMQLLTADDVTVAKKYEYRGERHYFSGRMPRPVTDRKVGVYIEFRNDKNSGLGMPLPKGTFRVYKRDDDDSLQFLGEDSIDHTPRDEEVKVKIGEAFDIVAERKQTDYQRIGDNAHQNAFEIKIRNHKDEDIVVEVVEPIPGDWQITEKSHEFEKTDAFTATFHIPVAKDGESVLTYRVLIRY